MVAINNTKTTTSAPDYVGRIPIKPPERSRMKRTVHVFAGSFGSRENACSYTEAMWEPEPDESVSDEEYQAWEDRNPRFPLRADLGVYLDSAFIETIHGDHRYRYLQGLLADQADAESIIQAAGPTSDTLVLIFHDALGGFGSTLKSTPQLVYCGEYRCDLS